MRSHDEHAHIPNVSPVLLVALVEHGVWSPTQALAYARQLPNLPDSQSNWRPPLLTQRLHALTGLLPHLPDPLRDPALGEALTATAEIRDAGDRALALGMLARHLPESSLPEALAIARALHNDFLRARALTSLAPHLPRALLPEALAIAQEITHPFHRATALASLVPHLPESLLAPAHHALRAIEKPDSGPGALPAPEAVASAQAQALARLAARMAELGQPHAALELAQTIESPRWQAQALGELTPQLPEPLREATLQEALGLVTRPVGYRWSREEKSQWNQLGYHVPPLACEEAFAQLEAAWGAEDLMAALLALAPHLLPALLPQALAAARGIPWEDERAQALIELAGYLPEPSRGQAAQEALAAVRSITAKLQQGRELQKLARRLVELDRPQEALAAAGSIQDESGRAGMLVELAPHLPATTALQALETARALESARDRCASLAALAPRLPEPPQGEVLGEALATARGLQYPNERARELTALIPHLSEPQKSQVLQEALETARTIKNPRARVPVLAGLIPHLQEPTRGEASQAALTAVQEIDEERWRTTALLDLVPHLPPEMLVTAMAAILPGT